MSERKCERCESRLYPSDKRVCVACVELDAERAAFQRGSEHGQRFEREAIVAWLRDLRVDAGENITTGEADRLADVADWIEHGDHLRSDDDQQV